MGQGEGMMSLDVIPDNLNSHPFSGSSCASPVSRF
jgi:hypothetical protein